MLPRNGFFKNIRCPYDKAHLCLRPYCHYKHTTSGNAENKIAAVSSSYLYDTNSNLPSQKRSAYSSETVKFEEETGYIPTPVNKPASILKVSEVPVVPEYKPTPISKLKELNIPHGHFESNSYSPEYVNPVKRKKNIEEYDPTEIKFVPKKSVSFADETGGGLTECEPGFSSDEDFEDSASAPKFSDDDFEDNVQSRSSLPSWAATSIKKPDPPIQKEKDEESDLDEKKIDEFSLVDKILIETKRNEKLLKLSKRDVVQVKPVPIPEKTPLILKGAKAKSTNTSSKKPNKTFSNSDIYSMEDDSQGSIPDYSAFDSILPPIEIDTLIKNKYDKKTFDSTASISNSLQCFKESEANTTVDASKSLINDKSSENSTKISKVNSKFKKSDGQSKSSNIDEKSKNKKKTKSTKSSSKVTESKLSDSSKQKVEGKSESSKNSSEKDKGHNKQSSEKVKNSKKTLEKSKESSNKSKEVSNKTSDTIKKSLQKDMDKIKESNKNANEKTKSKSNERALKHKINSKGKSKISNSSSKDSNKNIVSSSSEAELQDGKVSSSCVVNKSKSGEKPTSSKTMNHSSKDSNSSKKPFKRKREFSDSESNSEREHSKSKTSIKKLKKKDDSGSMDESDDEIINRSKGSMKKSARYIKSSDDAISTSDDDVKIIEISPGNSDLKNKSSLSLKKKRTNSNNSSIDEDIIISSDSDCDPSEECWKIYNETFNEASDENTIDEEKQDIPKDKSSNFKDVSVLRKKRLAHAAAATIKKPKSLEKLIKQPMNPGQVMHNRYALLMKMKEDNEAKSQGSAVFNSPGRTGGRIAVSPNNSLLAAINEKKKLSQSAGSSFTPLPSTVTKTLKPTKRVAHIPDMISKPRPIIPADFGSKVPTNIRQKFLNTFIDEYLKITSTEEEAYDEALEEEKKAYLRSTSKAIYMNVASNALATLRRKSNDISNEKKSNKVTSSTNKKTNKSVSHETVLNGPLAQRTSFSIEKKKPPPVPDLKGTALYEYLLTYAMSEDQLKENGFPMPHPSEPGKAVIEGIYANKSQYCNDQFKRTCCRCQKVYYVNVDGDYVRDEECDFHWGRLWKRRIAGALESRYSCCQGDAESDGCCVGTGHVFEGSEASAFKGFVKTLPKTPPPDKYYGIYALDCEMCYTTAGIELTRVTVVGPDLKPVYETFVKPSNKVLDYNTRFSGITEENLKNCRATLRDVQAVLLCLFNSRTILLGHSLESDFKALKLIHTTVVDTSVVFPHKMGLPYKRALRTLMGEKLNKIIQNEVGGHDSQEDAMACMELMLWKIKEDVRSNR